MKPSRVMLIDDDDDSREAYELFLRSVGYAPISAQSGDEAQRLIAVAPPDLILLDVFLRGGTSGLNLLAKLRSERVTREIPVILLTGADPCEPAIAQAPADLCLQKPILPRELAVHIARLLSRPTEGVQPRMSAPDPNRADTSSP